jgi:hypothetical protein
MLAKNEYALTSTVVSLSPSRKVLCPRSVATASMSALPNA